MDLLPAVLMIKLEAEKEGDQALKDFCLELYACILERTKPVGRRKPDKYLAYRKVRDEGVRG